MKSNRNIRILKAIKTHTKKVCVNKNTARQSLIDSGIYLDNGDLHPNFGGPKTKEENMTITNKEKIFAYEGFIVNMQISLNSAMEERGLTRKDLSKLTGYSDYEILNFFDEMSRNNLNYMEMMTTIAYVIGYEITLNLNDKRNYD